MGEHESGASSHYRTRVERGEILGQYEIKRAHLVAGIAGVSSYHEIGSGVAALPMLIALSGRVAVGIEHDPRRQAAACAFYDALRLERPELAFRCELIAGRFPDAVADRDVSESLAIVTDFVTTTSQTLRGSIIRGLTRYAAVILDVDRFLERRETETQRHALLTQLEAAGLKRPLSILDLGNDGRYCIILNGTKVSLPAMSAAQGGPKEATRSLTFRGPHDDHARPPHPSRAIVFS
jgi:hypothetical protein